MPSSNARCSTVDNSKFAYRDLITVTDLQLRTSALESDHWQRPAKAQPLVVSLRIHTDVSEEAQSDALKDGKSLNYGSVTKAIEKAVKGLPEATAERALALEQVAEHLAAVVIFDAYAPNITLEVVRPRALLSAQSIGVQVTRDRADYAEESTSARYQLSDPHTAAREDKLFVRELRRLIVIGLNACERLDEQEVICDFDFLAYSGQSDQDSAMIVPPWTAGQPRIAWREWRKVVKVLEQHLSTSAPLTIEHITTSLAKIITTSPSAAASDYPLPTSWDVPRARVRVAKPAALMFARHPAVQVTRERSDFVTRSMSTSTGPRVAYLGVGTNMGERVKNISSALSELKRNGSTRVVDASFLYESQAMYHEDQDKFLNAVVKIETSLNPAELLDQLKRIEQDLGRRKTFRNGPRPIDLDILLYGQLSLHDEPQGDRWLAIPHPRIAEREFVLRPLVDIAPTLRHPSLGDSPAVLLEQLLKTTESTVSRVLPLTGSLTHGIPSRETLVMSIVNTTPDSFSDGGDNVSVETAVRTAQLHLQQGAHIIDIGGMSTRPGAADVSVEEEAGRVVPVIQALRAAGVTAPISVDTFRAEVARQAIAAGADIINDVLGGSSDGMLAVMAELDVPVILMHSRGTPQTMSSMTEYPGNDIVAGVRSELAQRVQAALDAGVKRWNIVIDPGIGFAKTGQDNLVLLRRLREVLGEGQDCSDSLGLSTFPSLVGLSRKKFIGTLTGKQNAKERVLGTAAGVTASIAGGADIVRVHDVEAMVDVVKVADGIYRDAENKE